MSAVIKKTALVVQPMRGVSDAEIIKRRDEAELYLLSLGYTVDRTRYSFMPNVTFDIDNGVERTAMAHLGGSISAMASVDLVYFMKGWAGARGCVIEHAAAIEYGFPRLYEGDGRVILDPLEIE